MHRLQHALKQALDAQLNAVTAGNPAAADSHFRFLIGQLALGVIGLAAFPVWLALGAAGSPASSLAFLWLVAPVAITAFVLRTGNLARAQLFATAAFGLLVLWIAAMTGGAGSPLLVLFAAVPLAARLSGVPSAIWTATFVALAGISGSFVLGLVGAIDAPAEWQSSVAVLASAIVATLFAGVWAGRRDAAEPESEPAQTVPRRIEPEIEEAVASITDFADLLANARFVRPDSDEWRSFTRLIRVSGENLRTMIADEAVAAPALTRAIERGAGIADSREEPRPARAAGGSRRHATFYSNGIDI